MRNSTGDLRVGDAVRVRQARWRVTDIRPGDGCQVVTLAGCDVDNTGISRQVIAPFERIEIATHHRPVRVATMRRWRSACRSLLTMREWPASTGTAARAGIDLHPFQLEPLLAILNGLGSRVLIADDVGLGKTVQAGLIVSELRARGAADRVLILTPAGLRDQWAKELADRFGIAPCVVDMREGKRLAATLPIALNPWTTLPVAISSIDYVKRPEVLPSVRCCPWDLLIVDEAHAAGAGSERRGAVEALATRAAYVLLLSATPHNGDENAFRSLCALGALADPLLVFRRTRQEVALGAGRRIHQLAIGTTAEESAMHQALAEYSLAVRRERAVLDRERLLGLTTLCKRALSSAFALERSACRRRASLPHPHDHSVQLALPLATAPGTDDEFDPADEPPASATRLMEDGAAEDRLLARVEACASSAIPRQSKLRALDRLLRRLERLCERVIVFTEYRDTLLHVQGRLRPDAGIIHGGLTREERGRAVAAFTSGTTTLLFATDAAGEGLNLHQSCRVVVNLELPWNPMRLEQRIGRVDRIGQKRRVHVFHLISSHTAETRIRERLKERLLRANATIDTPNPLDGLDDDSEERTARDVIAEDRGDVEKRRVAEGCGVALAVPRLPDLALEEFRRLLFVRALSQDVRHKLRNDVSIASDGVVAFTRRRHLRTRFPHRTIALLSLRLEDTFGRISAIRSAPIVFPTTRSLTKSRRASAVELMNRVLDLPIGSIDRGARSWKETAALQHAAFWEVRMKREVAIAEWLSSSRQAAVQRGLFDQRADRRNNLDRGVRQEFIDAVARRRAAAEYARTAQLRTGPPLLLVIE